MKIESILLRLGENELAEFISKPALDILATFSPDTLRPKKIRDLILKKVEPETMLRKKSMRNILFESLRRDEARELLYKMGLDQDAEPYTTLCNMNIRKNTKTENELFNFFETVVPKPEHILEVSEVEKIQPQRGLFPHQLEAEKNVKRDLEETGHRTMLHMPTGAGKTRTAMRVVASYMFEKRKCFVIWLSYSEELCDQAMTEFQNMWKAVGDRPVATVRFYGNNTPDILTISKEYQGVFMVSGLKKMYEAARKNTTFLSTLADRVSLVVMDEAHQAVAATYKFILQTLVEKHTNGARLLGLSATPGRTWNNIEIDKELSEFFNRKKVTLKTSGSPIDFLIDKGYIANPTKKLIKYNGHLTDTERKKIAEALDIPEDILRKLAGEKLRNLKIIEAIEGLVAEGHKRIIFFAATIKHARDISFVLEARGLHTNYITSQTLPTVRKQIIEDYKQPGNTKILCNYGILTMGFDAPETSAVVIARPTKSLVLYSQMVGRCIRGPKAGGNEQCTIVTVVDTSLQGFGSVTDAFLNWEDVW